MAAWEPTFYLSYLDAHTMASPDKPSKSLPYSTASTARYNTPKQPPMTFSNQRSPSSPINVMSRGVPSTPSRKNVENLDTQFELDKSSFDKRANTYRRLAGEKYHHHKPPNSILTLWEEGHIADRGRARVPEEMAKGLFDPVLSHFKIPPSMGSGKQRPASSAPDTPPSKAHKVVQRDMGRYNPLTHSYHTSSPPSPLHAALKIKEFDRAHGGPSLGVPARVDPRGSFNPINGEWKPLQSGSGAFAPQADGGSHDGSGAARNAAARTASAPHQRPSSASLGGPKKQLAGDSWGTYDPIRHSWSVPPNEHKYKDQNKAFDRKHGISGNRVAITAALPTQGVYNPILNHWTVTPSDTRIIAGLSFAPATVFSRPTAATIRVK